MKFVFKLRLEIWLFCMDCFIKLVIMLCFNVLIIELVVGFKLR